jgi:ethanolamine utilization protein EutQ (cupin superfamily)
MEEGSDPMGGDQTKPSEIAKGPDYAPAGTTPDYARPTTQTVNRDQKGSLPPGTIKEAVVNKIMKKLEEKKMTKAEMSKEKEIKNKMDDSGMKASMKKQYGSKKGEKIYFAKIRKDAMKAAE